MKKMKLSSKAALSLALSAVLFCMPAAAFSMNGNYAMSVFAGETEQETETAKPEENTKMLSSIWINSAVMIYWLLLQ